MSRNPPNLPAAGVSGNTAVSVRRGSPEGQIFPPFDEKDLARFWGYVAQSEGEGCWRWTGPWKDSEQCGCLRIKGRNWRPQRIMWLLTHGTLPGIGCIYPLCRNKRCVRPEHLAHARHTADLRQPAPSTAEPLDPVGLGIPIIDGQPVPRFWERIQRSEGDGCWLWTGGTHRRGCAGVKTGGHSLPVRQVMWRLVHGEIPAGAGVTMGCRNRRCVRPDHIQLLVRRGGFSIQTANESFTADVQRAAVAYRRERLRAQLPATGTELMRLPQYRAARSPSTLHHDLAAIGARQVHGFWTLTPAQPVDLDQALALRDEAQHLVDELAERLRRKPGNPRLQRLSNRARERLLRRRALVVELKGVQAA